MPPMPTLSQPFCFGTYQDAVRATPYTFITPYLAGSIWYDEENLWVRGEFERDGSRIQYQLET